jgi:ectoine hydroxylase-related dioxygenase (phytanoyl-CoA dioxygenase family)
MTHTVRYCVLDPRVGNPTRDIDVDCSRQEIQILVQEGFIVREDWFSAQELSAMRAALDRIFVNEKDVPDERVDRYGGWRYFRHLMDKDPVFLNLLWFAPPRTIAQAVLGPQVRFDQVDAKYGVPHVASQYVPWHIHHRVIPDPLPPFFCYPHAIHCLLYLDPIDASNGPLCVLPGSHRKLNEAYVQDQNSDLEGQVVLSLSAGACVLMHANLWHRVLPSHRNAGYRRVILFGYLPIWVTGAEKGGVKPYRSVTDELRKSGDDLTRALLGEFYWG